MVQPGAQQTNQRPRSTAGTRPPGDSSPESSALDEHAHDPDVLPEERDVGGVLLPGEVRRQDPATTPVYGKLMSAALRSSPGAAACVAKDGRPSRS
jgi:hypothetical protein